MKAPHVRNDESGMALIITLMVLMLASALMVSFFAAISADQRTSGIDRDQTQAYAAAHAGLEKLTTDLARLFDADFSPSKSQIDAITVDAKKPVIPNFTFIAPDGTSGYTIKAKADSGAPNYTPLPLDTVNGTPITSGPFQGLRGIVTRYDLTSTARSTSGGAEARLRRQLQTVSIPVFQFGVFSESDLTFYGGDSFDMGGRVHTNANLYLGEALGATLTLGDRVTAAGSVIRAQLSNGVTTASGIWSGVVRVVKALPSTYRTLASNEGSVQGGPGSGVTANWGSLSMGAAYYNGFIRSGAAPNGTGAKVLALPLVAPSQGASPIDIIRRAPPNEDTLKPLVYSQRQFSMASLRILLSDTPGDITTLPGVDTTVAPIYLDGNWVTTPPPGYTVDATHPPVALSSGYFTPAATTAAGSTYSGGVVTNLVVSAVPGIPTFYKIPTTIYVGAGNFATVCTGRTATTFIGCAPMPASNIAVGATVSGTVHGLAVTATTTAVFGPASGGVITVNNAAGFRGTAPFAPQIMFVNGSLTECTGYDATVPKFTSCSGLAAAPAAGRSITTGALSNQGTGLLGGYIKIERQAAPSAGAVFGTWTDVTAEILNLGIAGQPLSGTGVCPAFSGNAVVQLQRIVDNVNSCNFIDTSTIKSPYYYWPNVLYDTREGNLRDSNAAASTTMYLGGVMHYVGLDVNNLRRWFAGAIGTTGTQAWNNNGYIVYFSDRRNNRNAANAETAEYGNEDVVNPATAAGTPTNALEAGEDLNGNGTVEVYGKLPSYNGTSNTLPPGATGNLGLGATPFTAIADEEARANRAIFFRRALKIVNATAGNLPAGLTIAAENPVYVQGNFNATAASVTGASVPASIFGDSITLLSNSWNDLNSFSSPNDPLGRATSSTGFRFAAVSGKALSFAQSLSPWAPGLASPQVGSIWGTDGGVGNFLHYLEDWQTSGATILYKGSIVSLFTSRQAVGAFKCCQNVYKWGTRNYSFDTNFLTPSLLPPGTPMFRDMNTLTFRQLLRPTE